MICDPPHKSAAELAAELQLSTGSVSTQTTALQRIGIVERVTFPGDRASYYQLRQREFQAMMREVADDGRCVFLSSHTLSEVQRVADRVGIIRSGHLVDVEFFDDLRSKAVRRIELQFTGPVEASVFEAVAGVRDVSTAGHHAVMSFDGSIDALLSVATDRYTLTDINTQEADLEEIFLDYYREDGKVSS